MASKKDNIVRIEVSEVTEMKFECTKYSVSKGQQLDDKNIEVSLSEDKLTWEINIKAGRHGTEEVAKWFKEQISSQKEQSGAVIACDSYDEMPVSLNFAVEGTMTMKFRDGKTVEIPDMVIAQGHNARSRNNWWLGGKNFQNVFDIKELAGIIKMKSIAYKKSKKVSIPEFYIFYPAGNKENQFNIIYISIQ